MNSSGQPRIAYLLKRFPRLSETFVLNEILELRRQGLELTVYALMDPHEQLTSPAAAAIRDQVIYLHRDAGGWRSWGRLLAGAAAQAGRRPLKALRVGWELLRVHRSMASLRHAVEALWLAHDLRRRGITHLHAHFAHSPAAVAYLARVAGGPRFSFTAHAKDLYTTLPRNLRIRCRAAEFVVTCTRFNRDYLEELLRDHDPRPVHVLYHGTELARFSMVNRRAQAGRIVSVGRLVEKKGHSVLLSAVGILRDRGVVCRLDLYGGGPLRVALTEQIARLGLEDRVSVHGARQQDEIITAYQAAACFALASVVTGDGDRDGIPNVLVEAMACGVPVISTRISGIPELIEDGVDGLLVPPGDARALADALQRVLEEPELAGSLALAGRHKVERRFDLAANTSRMRSLLLTGIESWPAVASPEPAGPPGRPAPEPKVGS